MNCLASLFALGAIVFAERPADRSHPYGHGKIEHFSAVFEGGLISLASALILYEAVTVLLRGPRLQNLDQGILINLTAGSLNGILGVILIRTGRSHGSKALEADGFHVLSDFWTTVGLGAGLFAAKLTGFTWLDPVLAIGVGLLLARTGFVLVRNSSQALLDMEDPEVINQIVGAINRKRSSDIIAIHELRTLRSGRYTHVDIHVVVPEFYEVSRAHDLVENFGSAVLQDLKISGECHTHVDPCARKYCEHCRVDPCPIRRAAFTGGSEITVLEATSPGYS